MQDRFKFRYHFDNKIWDVSEIDFDNQTLELKVDAFEAIHIKDFQYTKLNDCKIIGNIYENQELLEMKGE